MDDDPRAAGQGQTLRPGTVEDKVSIRIAVGSIGRALAIRPGVLNDDLRATIEAIDRVHGVANLPTIPMEFRGGMEERGRILDDSQTATPSRILIRLDAGHRTFTALHEVGHFLDLTAFQYGGTFGSSSNPVMIPWSRVIEESAAYQELDRLRRTQESPSVTSLLDPAELWARSYAQYIATRGGLHGLMASVDALRTARSGHLHIPVQWHDNDFDDIAAAIDDLFEFLGWRV